jgi:DNA-directed RNA polymerase subunit RPC12/RpoP
MAVDEHIACPYCFGERLAPARSVANALRRLFNDTMFIAAIPVLCALYLLYTVRIIKNPLKFTDERGQPKIEFMPRLELTLKCHDCGAKVPGVQPPIEYKCGRCGYDLRGTQSGKCPECAWRIPDMMRLLLHYEFGPGTGSRKTVHRSKFLNDPVRSAQPGRSPG